MRSLAEIVKANREAEKDGVRPVHGAVGVNTFVNTKLSPERLRKLGLDKY